jgi:CDGSH-type Zn-finger protein
MKKTEIKLLDDGPILVNGEWELVDGVGKVLSASEGKPVALCRCGASANKPFCDGAHKAAGFRSGTKKP